MPAGSPEQQFPVLRRALAGLAAAALLFVSDAATAQGFFDSFFRIFRAPYENYQPDIPRQPRIRQRPPRTPTVPKAPREQQASKPSAPPIAYCVRLCDGRYFPLPTEKGTASITPESRCSAMCPAVETRVFTGNEIERAASSDGKHYTALATAFLFRERTVDTCTCRSDGLPGLVSPDIRDDPTLRRGDIVITREGPVVFTGDGKPPHRSSQFVPAENYRGLPRSVRQTLSNIQVADEPPEDRPLITGRAVGSADDSAMTAADTRPIESDAGPAASSADGR